MVDIWRRWPVVVPPVAAVVLALTWGRDVGVLLAVVGVTLVLAVIAAGHHPGGVAPRVGGDLVGEPVRGVRVHADGPAPGLIPAHRGRCGRRAGSPTRLAEGGAQWGFAAGLPGGGGGAGEDRVAGDRAGGGLG